MLAVTKVSPKHAIRSAPKPGNWQGVAHGLRVAKQDFRAGNMASAEQTLRDVLELAPDETRAWAWLGKVMDHMGRQEQAAQYFKKAMALLKTNKLKPGMPISKPLARISWQQGDRGTARAMLSILLLQTPDDPQLRDWQHTWCLDDEQ